MKRVFLVHGWEGNPDNAWFPWLKKELEARGFEVFTPAMPNPEEPNRASWVQHLSQAVGVPDSETYFVGHSIGCKAIMRYLESLSYETQIAGVIFVASWLTLTHMEDRTEDELRVLKDWAGPYNFEKIKKIGNQFTAIFSDDDPDVPLENTKIFEKELSAKIIIESGRGHFSADAGVLDLPVALEELLKMAHAN
jgi:predicted alpha/beta hydrolase family esterase